MAINKKRDEGVHKIADMLSENFVFKLSIDVLTGLIVAVFVAILSTVTALLVSLVIGDKRNGTNSYNAFRGLIDDEVTKNAK